MIKVLAGVRCKNRVNIKSVLSKCSVCDFYKICQNYFHNYNIDKSSNLKNNET